MLMLKSILRMMVCTSMFLGPWWTINAYAANTTHQFEKEVEVSKQTADTDVAEDVQRTINTILAGEAIKNQQALNQHYTEQTDLDAAQAQAHQLAFQIASAELNLHHLQSPVQRALLSKSLKQLIPAAYEYSKRNASRDLQQQWANRFQALGLELNKPTSAHQLAQSIQVLISELDAQDPMAQWLNNASQHLQQNPALAEAEATLYRLSGQKNQALDCNASTSTTNNESIEGCAPSFTMAHSTLPLNDFILAGQDYQAGYIMFGIFDVIKIAVIIGIVVVLLKACLS